MQEKIGRIRKSALFYNRSEIPIENLKIPFSNFLRKEKAHPQSGRVSGGIRDPGPKKYRDGWRDKPNTHKTHNTHNGHNNNDR
eukprot:scaffold56389_cov75-Cyclotella_meneghiniana.AAC.7